MQKPERGSRVDRRGKTENIENLQKIGLIY
jgi:hypothetical protein